MTTFGTLINIHKALVIPVVLGLMWNRNENGHGSGHRMAHKGRRPTNDFLLLG